MISLKKNYGLNLVSGSDLFFEQWHRPEEETPHLPEPTVSELHFLFRDADADSGGLPVDDETWLLDRSVIWNPEQEERENPLLSVSPPVRNEPTWPDPYDEKFMVVVVLEESFRSAAALLRGGGGGCGTGGICWMGVAQYITYRKIKPPNKIIQCSKISSF